MKSLVFDTGPVISLTVNNLLWLLQPLQQLFKGAFYIPEAVHAELVDRPLQTKRFKFEALQVEEQIENGVFSIIDTKQIRERASALLMLANNAFIARGQPLRVCQYAELETLAAGTLSNANAVVIDERITRTLVENPTALQRLLQKRLHTPVQANKTNITQFQSMCTQVPIIRSVELVTIAYERGLLDKYLVKVPNVRQQLLESVLWGVKLHGAAISEQEIEEILRMERK